MVIFGGLELVAGAYILHEVSKSKREKKRIEAENEYIHSNNQRRSRRHSHEGTTRPSSHRHHHTRHESPEKSTQDKRHRREETPDRRRDEAPTRREEKSKSKSGKGDTLMPPSILKNKHRAGSAPPAGSYPPPHNPGQWQQPHKSMNGPAYDDTSTYVSPHQYPPPPQYPTAVPTAQLSYPTYIPPQASPPPAPVYAVSHYTPPPHGVWELPTGTELALSKPLQNTARPMRPPFSPHVRFADQVQSNYGSDTPPPPYREV